MSSYPFCRISRTVSHIRTEHRVIETPIPAPGTAELLERLDAVESRSMHGQLPIIWDRAHDYAVFDASDNRWIDFTSGIFAANVGHANEAVLTAMNTSEMLHAYSYATKIRAEYIERLTKWSGFEKAFLLSSGTEATEAALKLMRMHGQNTGKRRLGIICIEGNWHGRTLGAQMMSGNSQQRAWIGYQDADIHHIAFPYPWAPSATENIELFLAKSLARLERRGINLTKDVCGFMLETFQGWGALFYPPEYVRAIEAMCRNLSIVLCFDEMQSGFARTGRKFGYEHYGVKPDLICVGKGMGNGVPLSGVLGRLDILDLPEVGNMSSTHSANPLVCAAGLAVLSEIERLNLVREAERKGSILRAALTKLLERFPERICYVSGKGLIAALIFRPEDSAFASEVAERCMLKGVLVVHTGRESIKIGPPLTIPDAALIEGVEVLGEAIGEIDQ